MKGKKLYKVDIVIHHQIEEIQIIITVNETIEDDIFIERRLNLIEFALLTLPLLTYANRLAGNKRPG